MRRSVRTSYLGLAVVVSSGWAQVMKPDGCLLLSGTITCPPWITAWVNPNELVNAGYPEFANVTDLASFDAAAVSYIGNLDEYRAVKFGNDGLGCTNASSAVIRYSRTVLCSTWLNLPSSLACFNSYSEVDRDIGPKYVCQDTCNQYAANEHTLTQNPQYCPTDPTAGNRYVTLIRDYSSCTDWLSPLTNNTNTCIQGDRNEGGCGFGGSSAQLCAHCNTTTPDDCCYQCPCGYVLAARPTSTTSSSATSTGTGGAGIVGGGSKGLSGGQIAGIVIGSVIGGLLLLGLLIGLLLCCGILGGSRRNKRENESEKAYYGSGSGSDNEAGLQDRPSTGAAFATFPRGSATTASPSMSTSAPGMPGALAAPLPLAAGAVPGVGERSVLASIKDENQSGEHLIYPNSMVTVLWPYTASMGDEVTLIPGMRLKVSRLYDDAWATGQVEECAEDPSLKGREGAFPLVCVTQANVPVVAGRS